MPQNVNFAIRGEIAKLFLAQNGVDPELSLSRDVAAPVAIAEQATKFTTFIECK
jgi:serine protease Do